MIPHVCPSLGTNEREAVHAALVTRVFDPDRLVAEFEDAVAAYLGGGYAVATNSGFAALHLALSEFSPSTSSLWIPDYAGAAAITAADHSGFLYRLLDCRPDSFLAAGNRDDGRNMRIGVHLFGEADQALALRDRETLIEEVSEAAGVWLNQHRAGTFGVCGIFSFTPYASLFAGEGGLLFSQNRELIVQARDRASYDYKNSYRPRYAYRMPALEAAVGLAQLHRIDELIGARRQLAETYYRRLSECVPASALPPAPAETEHAGRPVHVYSRFCLRLSVPAEPVLAELQEVGVDARRPIYLPAHRLLKQNPADFPQSEAVHQGTIALPFYPSLSPADVETILDATCRTLERHREA